MLIFGSALLGAIIGSFLNVLILRHGYSESTSSRSHCMACNEGLQAHALIPIFSFFLLRGRCAHCGSKISLQYPSVEVITAVLFALTAYALPFARYALPDFIALISFFIFWAGLVAVVVYDLRHTLVPLLFIGVMAVGALLKALAGLLFVSATTLINVLLGGIVWGGFFFMLYLITRGRGLGLGDAYIAGVIGMMFGFSGGFIASVAGVWIGAAVGLTLVGLSLIRQHRLAGGGNRVTLKTEIPFAPFLAAGALVAFVAEYVVWGGVGMFPLCCADFLSLSSWSPLLSWW